MTRVFISYSRKDKQVAKKLVQALEKCELETWIDWEDIPPTSDWRERIQRGIEEADGFLFLLSPDSIASKVCREECEHAIQNGKRLIPVVVLDVDSKDVLPAMAKINWFSLQDAVDFENTIQALIAVIRTDLPW